MMASQRRYVIRYRLNGQLRRFWQADSNMTSADAWYYASLHAGARHLYGVAAFGYSEPALRQLAEQHGLTDVGFHVARNA